MKKTLSLLCILGLIAIPLVPAGLVLRDAAGQTEEVWFVGAGDIADCRKGGNREASRHTRWLLDDIIAEANGKPVAIFTVGDNSYRADDQAFSVSCYEYPVTDPRTGVVSLKGWGKYKSITYPAPGNHDYQDPYPNGERYHDYFGGEEGFTYANPPVYACRASGASNPRTGPPSDPFSTIQCGGEPGKGWYTFRFGDDWRIIVLNSERVNAEQVQWLEAVLQSEPSRVCTLAIWHHPRFSSGHHGDDTSMAPLWDVLRDYRADVIVTGHDHNYERFSTSMTKPDGTPNPAHSMRQFVVGTGGADERTRGNASTGLSRYFYPEPNELQDEKGHGVLLLKLRSDSYDWAFIPKFGTLQAPLDSGTGVCRP